MNLKKLHSKSSFLKNIPIAKRILLLILTISFLPIMAIGFYSYTITKSSITNLSFAYNQKLVHTLQSNMRLHFQNYIQISDELMLDSTVREALTSYDTLSPDEKYNIIMDIIEKIRSKFTRIADVFNIQITTTENIPIYNTGFLFLDNKAYEEQFRKISSCEDNTLWYISRYNNDVFFVLSRKITDMSGNLIGYITMHMRPDTIMETLSDYGFQDLASVGFIDSFQENYSVSGEDNQPTLSKETLNYINTYPKDGKLHSYSNDKNFFVNYTYSNDVKWTLIATTPYSVLKTPIDHIRLGILIMLLICIIVSIIVARYIGQSITKPLSKMVSNIQTLSNSQLDIPPENKTNELEFLSDAYIKILKKMQSLSLQVQAEQEEKRKAEIKMLQAQINPHFLFNTLDSLKFTALMSNAPTVSKGLSSFSRILRNSIINGKSYIPITEEIKNIEDYLFIQKIRHGEIFNFHWKISTDAQNCSIMKFLLQPLVENSVIHGMQEDTVLEIYLDIQRKENTIFITLGDNGKGFDVEKQYDIQTSRFKSSKMSGIGLENVRQRLFLEYKEKQSFSIHSQIQNGTIIEISFPALEHLELNEKIRKE